MPDVMRHQVIGLTLKGRLGNQKIVRIPGKHEPVIANFENLASSYHATQKTPDFSAGHSMNPTVFRTPDYLFILIEQRYTQDQG